MAGVISEVVERMMRSYLLENGGDMKKSVEAESGESLPKPLEFIVESGEAEEGAASIGKAVSSAYKRVRETLAEAGSPYELSIDRDTNRVVIKMFDPASGAVERQFPEQSLIELSKRLEDLTGSVFNART